MKKPVYLFAIFALMFFAACEDQLGTTTISYTKAKAIYADLDEIRETPLKGEVSNIVNPGKIFVAQNILLIGEEEKGIHVVDNSSPENPVQVAFINIPGNREFYVQDDIIYAESYYDMIKIDASDINNPILISRVENAFSADLWNQQGEALIGFEFEEVTEKLKANDDVQSLISANEINYFDYLNRIIPASNVPASFAGNSQQSIGTINRIAVSNEHVYVISRQFLTTFRDQSGLEFISSRPESWQMETIYPHGNNLFIGTMNSMEIYDISNPETPTRTSAFWHANSCDPVFPMDNVAYLTLRSEGTNCPGNDNLLIALDISDVTRPVQMQQIEMTSPYGLSMIGDKLYVGEGANGLKIFDASNRLNLRLLKWDQSIQAYDVLTHPDRSDLLLIAGPQGLGQYTLSNDDIAFVSNMSF